jgi:hypothetical protein
MLNTCTSNVLKYATMIPVVTKYSLTCLELAAPESVPPVVEGVGALVPYLDLM